MSRHLRTLGQQSQHTYVLYEGLQRVRIPQILSAFEKMDSAIIQCQERKSRRLEAEMRLIQLACRFTCSKNGDEYALLNVQSELGQVMKLCERFPQTAGLLLPAYQLMRSSLTGHRTISHCLYNPLTRETWWTWVSEPLCAFHTLNSSAEKANLDCFSPFIILGGARMGTHFPPLHNLIA